MYTMEYKGFKAQIKEARRLTGTHTHGLPPGSSIQVYHADEFIAPPENWMKGPGIFIVPVTPEKGLWFDWTDNDELNTAVIPTVKGCNPINGMKTSGFHLEKYENKCPKHRCNFLANRFCPECNYSWPDRNYCSMNPLWWDGFRADDGTIRQFFFTADSMRDVATALIGKKNTVPAFGFAFYTPKEKRKPDVSIQHRVFYSNAPLDGGDMLKGGGGHHLGSPAYSDSLGDFGATRSLSFTGGSNTLGGGIKKSLTANNSLGKTRGIISSKSLIGSTSDDNARGIRGIVDDIEQIKSPVKSGIIIPESTEKKETAEVSIGAGARIRQSLNKDIYPLESWKDTPDSVMTIYFVFQEKFEEIKAGGMRDVTGQAEGMLSDIPVG